MHGLTTHCPLPKGCDAIHAKRTRRAAGARLKLLRIDEIMR